MPNQDDSDEVILLTRVRNFIQKIRDTNDCGWAAKHYVEDCTALLAIIDNNRAKQGDKNG